MFKSLLSLLLASTMGFGNYGPHVFDDSTLLSVASIPVQKTEMVAPAPISAKAVIAIDLESQTVLFRQNSDLKLPIASLTKLMTAYIALNEEDPDALVTISANAAATLGSRMGLRSGEQITVKNLLYGLLIASGNDAAVALAEYNAGDERNFVKKMNQKARQIGLDQTQYANSTGLDNGESYSTPHDLALLASYLIRDDTIREIVSLKTADVSGHKLESTNTLLGQMGIKGIKTGFTEAAGECLATLAVNPSGKEILIVVLGSTDRFYDTKILLDWIYRAYIW
ncbi:D-alanyl-D-alanine carboxypeptidase [Candidatus Peregrinibacteria bacterium]|nr:D-alanyl-D-alanine carboxypeptidase [Candidatus Peregrinibacteria bacterium]